MKTSLPFAAVCLAASSLLYSAATSSAGLTLVENFTTNPLSTWNFGIGSNGNSQFTYQTDAAAYAGDVGGSLKVHLNSSLPTSRLQLPLGFTLGPTMDFTVSAQFSLANVNALPNRAMEFAFGLVNTGTTGGNRTGSSTSSANTFHTVEVDYFPNLSPLYGYGATLTPSIFGAQKNTGGIFANYATIFGTGSDLGDNTPPGITALPQYTNLQAVLSYAASTHAFTLQLSQIAPDGSLTTLVTEVPVLDLYNASTYDQTRPFQVNALAIMAYQDGYNTSAPPTLSADVTFQKISVNVPDAVVQNLAALTLSGGSTTLSSVLGNGNSTITVNPNATLNITASQTLSALTIGSGGKVQFSSGSAGSAVDTGFDKSTVMVPEPGSAALLLSGACLFPQRRRRLV